jgi:clan AA aspartic protease
MARSRDARTMGITMLTVKVANPGERARIATVDCIVDSGAILSVIPSAILRRIGVRPTRTERFTLADGSHIKRRLGDALFEIAGRHGASPVVFGEKGDATLLGAVTLGALGLMLDPLNRELRPVPVLLV